MKYPAAILAAATAFSLACCKSKSSSEEPSKAPAESVLEIQKNRLADEPTALLSYAADSKINWQPWSPEILQHAEKSQRMILVLIGSARYSGCFETLEALDRYPALVQRINDEYVPALADIDLTRETGLLSNYLSSEAQVPVSFPFLLFLSPEGSPVTWQAINYESDQAIQGVFDNSLEVVGRLWDDDPAYVTKDSASKNAFRRENLPDPDKAVPDIEERRSLYEGAIRRLESFYDEDVSTLAGSGGLFPFGLFDFFALVRHDQSLPESERVKVGETLESFVTTVLSSSMVDVLDGGIHSARRGRTWNLVMGRRDCATQARAGRIFARMHQLDGYPGSLETAINAVRFAEERFRTQNGLFSLNEKPNATKTKDWLWNVDQISSVLTEDEFKVWERFSNLSNIGNLPSEADPNRNFFRLNSLSAALSPAEVSAESGMDLVQVKELIESGRKKLSKARESRMPRPDSNPTPSALASFRMVSAYASLYAATKNDEWLEKAVGLGRASRKSFLSRRFLNERPDAKEDGSSDGRAFNYAIAVQAGLDLGAVTLDDEWYSWAQDLTTLLAEHFVSKDGRLLEVREVSQVVDTALEDRIMVFDDSSAGLVRLNIQRLRALGYQTPPSLAPWLESLPDLERIPLIFTDTLLAVSHEWNHTLITAGPETTDDLLGAVKTLPLQLFVRRRNDAKEVSITPQKGDKITTSETEDVKNLLRAQ